MPNTREKPAELIDKWEVVNKLIQLENNYQFYKEQWDADVLYRRICELEIGIGKTPGVTVQEWISVKDRLPEAHRLVLCRWTRGIGASYGFARYQHENDVWYVSNEGMPEVTHWMPLPQPPKE